jgi:molybdate transport system substrate-binding protein
MDLVAQAGKVAPSSRRDLLSNRLVVVVPRGRGLAVRGPRDLLQVHRLAIADPALDPAGIYAKQWLIGEGLWNALTPTLIPASDVRATLRLVESGVADAAIVYQSDAQSAPAVRATYRVPLEKTPSIRYPVAKLARARDGSSADDLLRFLQTSEASVRFLRRGFLMVAAP